MYFSKGDVKSLNNVPFPELWMALIAFFNFAKPSRSKSKVCNKIKTLNGFILKLQFAVTPILATDCHVVSQTHNSHEPFNVGSNICRTSRLLICTPRQTDWILNKTRTRLCAWHLPQNKVVGLIGS